MGRRFAILFLGIFLLAAGIDVRAQSPTKMHWNPFSPAKAESPMHGRNVKLRINVGPVFQFISTDPHYTNSTTGSGAYTMGFTIEFPILKTASILVGMDFMKESFTFNSYFFAPGYSFLYDGSENYNHAIDIDELQFPIEYKFCFPSEIRNARTFYATFGWVFRYFVYDNALVTNLSNGAFVWEGQKNITAEYNSFTPRGCGVIEASLGYQRNYLRTGNAFFFEVQYKLCPNPLVYSGNNNGSNYVLFTLSSLALKIGLRL
jgi:hypothetical protein